ncbi:Uncharacterised protein, partial [Mycoplasmopsis synoviae]
MLSIETLIGAGTNSENKLENINKNIQSGSFRVLCDVFKKLIVKLIKIAITTQIIASAKMYKYFLGMYLENTKSSSAKNKCGSTEIKVSMLPLSGPNHLMHKNDIAW